MLFGIGVIILAALAVLVVIAGTSGGWTVIGLGILALFAISGMLPDDWNDWFGDLLGVLALFVVVLSAFGWFFVSLTGI